MGGGTKVEGKGVYIVTPSVSILHVLRCRLVCVFIRLFFKCRSEIRLDRQVFSGAAQVSPFLLYVHFACVAT